MENTAVNNKTGGVTGSTLKIIAIVIMFIDHFAGTYMKKLVEARGIETWAANGFYAFDIEPVGLVYNIMRMIGRIAFPIFIFLIVEGYTYTRNKWKYLGRLFLFAFISEIPFDLAFSLTKEDVLSGTIVEFLYQNVFFTLALGLLTIILMDTVIQKIKSTNLVMRVLKVILILIIVCVMYGVGDILAVDYYGPGVMAIAVAWLCRKYRWLSVGAACIVLTYFYPSELTAFLAIIPVLAYNGQRGLKLKHVFYAFYPVHLLLLGCLCLFV